MKGKPEAKSKCDDCPIDVEIRRNTHCCERCTDEHPAYERKLETNALLQSKPTESKRPELTDERFANWCMDTFEDQKDKYLAFSVEQSKWIDVLEARLSVHDAELSKLQEKIDFTEYQYDDLAYWFGKMQKDNEALEGENKKLRDEISELKTGNDFLNTENLDLMGRLSAIDLFAKKLNQKYEELLKGEQDNYSTAMAMDTCAEKSDLLSHSWGRIKLLKDILRELGVLLPPFAEKLDQKTEKALKFVEHIEQHIKNGDDVSVPRNAKVLCKFCDKTIDEIAQEGLDQKTEGDKP